MIPQRQKQQTGLYALVDGIPFQLPVNSEKTPALIAVFPINADRAKKLMPGKEVHPFRLWNQGLLVITVIDYQITDIGSYIEFSIAIACTHGAKPAPRLLPALFMKQYGTGQYVFDLPVSTEISVKGGKGIWGMPKHQANLDFLIGDRTVSSQYDLDGQLVMKIEVAKPAKAWFPLKLAAANYCAFRGMLMKSYIYFQGKLGFSLFKPGSARLILGDHPCIQPLKELEISPEPIFTGFFPEITGILDDHFENWFLGYDKPPKQKPEGLESVVNLGLGKEWLSPPKALPKDDDENLNNGIEKYESTSVNS
ncbi:MAG: acetoacetate decarboxylase family protein [Nostoc sp.]|uniref:acetoacetate decarboxylase family protein n=1 Tax=Nostoc sp. TaxID=1180 RepID=UPI002FFC6928